nr:hypothetical protein [Tanacetum cinerariifolium]
MSESPELLNESYVLYDRVMNPLTAQQEPKTSKDRGTRRGHHSTSSSFAFDQPSSSHLNHDDNDGNDKGTLCASTLSPTYFVNSLTNEIRDEHRGGLRSIEKGLRNFWRNINNDEYVTTTPSIITTSSSPSPPNSPSKTPSTKDTSSTFGTTSSLFESKPQSSPPTSNDTPSPQPSNHFLKNVMDAPPIPLHQLPLQSHPSLDITLSLSPITPVDYILDTPSPPSPQPQLQ